MIFLRNDRALVSSLLAPENPSMAIEAWGVLSGIGVTALGFAIHCTWQLGLIKGSLDRDLVQLRRLAEDHEDRLRKVELKVAR